MRKHRFDVVLVWAFNHCPSGPALPRGAGRVQPSGIEFISFRENIETGGLLGRAMVVIVGAIAELERSLIVERVRAGMRRARLQGRHIGRRSLEIDRTGVLRDRASGMSVAEAAKLHRVSRATPHRVLREQVRPVLEQTA